jgi:cytochrome P450
LILAIHPGKEYEMTPDTGEPDVMAPEFMADPYREYGRLREQGALVRGTLMGQVPVWYVTRFAEVNTVLSDPRFVNDPASVPGVEVGDESGAHRGRQCSPT